MEKKILGARWGWEHICMGTFIFLLGMKVHTEVPKRNLIGTKEATIRAYYLPAL